MTSQKLTHCHLITTKIIIKINEFTYRDTESGDAIDESGGGEPGLARSHGIGRGNCKRPLEEEFQMNKTYKEVGPFRHQVVVGGLGVPSLGLHRKRRHHLAGKACRRVQQRRYDGDDHEVHQQHAVHKLAESHLFHQIYYFLMR